MDEFENSKIVRIPRKLLAFRLIIIGCFTSLTIVFSLYLSFLLRFDFSIPAPHDAAFLRMILPALLVKSVVFWWFGLHRGWWRYASLADAVDITKAVLVSSTILVLYLSFTYRLEGFPRSIFLLDGAITFLILTGVRFMTRLVRERYLPFLDFNSKDRIRTLIVGAGESGQSIVREIRKSGELKNDVIGFVDDNPMVLDARFQGMPVLGAIDSIAKVCSRHSIEEIIIALPMASAEEIRRIVEICRKTGVIVKTLPGISELINGSVNLQQVRDVDVADLLGRHQIQLDQQRIDHYLKRKRILVTGAAGSIGSEICRQLVRFDPENIILVDSAESPLFYVEREFIELYELNEMVVHIGDIRDRARMEAIFEQYKPQVVFHAAAYKHVPMMESNHSEAISTNIHGTRVLADAAIKFGVESFVMISTDKAVNPTNIMGASKRVAEIYVQSLSKSATTRFTTVRFGNVLGSAGSVIPTFKEQIRKGGPVKVTHPEVTRFFMTISEATQLVLQAGSMGVGGEIFLLDMGESVKIVDLAEELIRLSGYKPYVDIDIEFIGLRPGEKLYEELLLAGEDIKPTEHESIRVANTTCYDEEVIREKVEQFYVTRNSLDRSEAILKLKEVVPEFEPAQNVQSQ